MHLHTLLFCPLTHVTRQMWNLRLPVSPASVPQLAHEETHPGGPLQLHLRVLREEVREAGERQIPQAKEPPGQAGDLRHPDTGVRKLNKYTGWPLDNPRKTSSEETDFPLLCWLSCPGWYEHHLWTHMQWMKWASLIAVQNTVQGPNMAFEHICYKQERKAESTID